MSSVSWSGVFPAVTSQFRSDYSLDLSATGEVIEALINDGVSGLVVCGTVGEGCSLTANEKRAIVELAVGTASGRIPVLVGVAEYTTALAADLAKDSAARGADGIMLLPAMVYTSKPREVIYHYNEVAKASDLPIMIYNNPPSYKIDLTPDIVVELAKIDTVQSMKDSSGAPNRLVDIRNALGDRLTLFCGLDDVLVESVALGAEGWVSGISNVFPQHGEALFRLAKSGDMSKAMEIYNWFMPLLHLDARPDLVQCIKLCEQIAGRGTELTRPPRLTLEGAERAEVEAIMATALANVPVL